MERTLKIYSAGLDCETNTFSTFPTTWQSFREVGIWRGDAGSGSCWMSPVPRTFRQLAKEYGFEYIEGLYAAAQPAGPVLRGVFEALRDEILCSLTSQGPFDIVLLHLHGAMVAEGYDDCEGELLCRVRRILGEDAVIGAILDPHCHLSQTMMDCADILVTCKHFPHDDYTERAAELFNLCLKNARGEIHPVAAMFDCAMVGLFPTQDEPMASIVRMLVKAEREPGLLSASFVHGFPWGDTVQTGSKTLVYADGSGIGAAQAAESLGRAIYRLREQLLPRYPTMDEALNEAERAPGLVVLADTADNAGGGAPGDNVALLSRLLHRGIKDAAVATVWDPQVSALCADAGVGAHLTVRLGGKTNASSGDPIDVSVLVRAIQADHFQTSLGDTRQPMGLCVWLEIDGVDVIVSTVRSQVFAPDIFTGLGVDIASKKLLVVKSINHFFARFAPIATRIIRVATPGALAMDFGAIEYRKRSAHYHPRIADPLMIDAVRAAAESCKD